MNTHLIFLVLVFIVSPVTLWARPEYALQANINRCTACHMSPIGGGVRNLNGKQYGTRQLGFNSFSKQEYFSADVRMLNYDPGYSKARSGAGVMAALFSLNAPLKPESDELILSYTQDIGGWTATGRNAAYLRWKNSPDTETSWRPQYIMAGRFPAPFGLINDEHRTYTQIQTKNSWNTDFEMGVNMSANPYDWVHYDLAFVNGEKSAGANPSTDRANLWGAVGNLRFMPVALPIIVGVSSSHHERTTPAPAAWANSVYAMLSLNRATNYWLKGSLAVQYNEARHWNQSITNFVQDATYLTSVNDSTSAGWFSQFNWDIDPLFTVVLKYDQLILDKSFPADYYTRYGVGLKHWIAPNSFINVRYEDSAATHPTEIEGQSPATLDGYWLMLQVSI